MSRTSGTEAALGHDFGEWTTAEAPTCTVPGVRRRTCRRSGCSAEEEESIPATGVHQASAPVRENEVAATCLGEGTPGLRLPWAMISENGPQRRTPPA